MTTHPNLLTAQVRFHYCFGGNCTVKCYDNVDNDLRTNAQFKIKLPDKNVKIELNCDPKERDF